MNIEAAKRIALLEYSGSGLATEALRQTAPFPKVYKHQACHLYQIPSRNSPGEGPQSEEIFSNVCIFRAAKRDFLKLGGAIRPRNKAKS